MSAHLIHWSPAIDPIGPAVVSIGVFDGVHLGHQTLIRDAAETAATFGVRAVVVTFDRDPDQVVTPEDAAPQLLPVDDKLALIVEAGAKTVLVVPFDEAVSRMSPKRFLDIVLLGSIDPVLVMVGEDFRFGHRAEGDLRTLRSYGERCGFEVEGHPLVSVDGEPVTSTRIRRLVTDGEVQAAARLLGRPHRVRGVVERGRGAGERIGVRTANLSPSEHAALPAEGVYAGRAIVEEGVFPAGISVGRPPSFPDATHMLEAALLDFDSDLYGRTITLEFVQRLRRLRSFDGERDLEETLQEDLRRVRAALHPSSAPSSGHGSQAC